MLLQHVNAILFALREHHLRFKCNKCSFAKLLVVYFGHVISVGGVAMDHEKGGGHHLLATTPLNAWPPHVPRASGVLPPINLGLWHHHCPSNSTAQEGVLHVDS